MSWIVMLVAMNASPAPAAARETFPLVEGSAYVYKTDAFGGSSLRATLRRDRDGFTFDDRTGVTFQFCSRCRVTARGFEVGDAISDVYRLAIAFPPRVGASRTLTSTLSTRTWTVVARETVTVPAGTFEAFRIAHFDDQPFGPCLWLAPGVGVVKLRDPNGWVHELVRVERPDELSRTRVDPPADQAHLERACAEHDAKACLHWGMRLQLGTDGVTQDRESAVRTFDEACRLGEEAACSLARSSRGTGR